MSHMENMIYKLKSSDFLIEPQRIGYFGRKDLQCSKKFFGELLIFFGRSMQQITTVYP